MSGALNGFDHEESFLVLATLCGSTMGRWWTKKKRVSSPNEYSEKPMTKGTIVGMLHVAVLLVRLVWCRYSSLSPSACFSWVSTCLLEHCTIKGYGCMTTITCFSSACFPKGGWVVREGGHQSNAKIYPPPSTLLPRQHTHTHTHTHTHSKVRNTKRSQFCLVYIYTEWN